jgi:hypothetical protein
MNRVVSGYGRVMEIAAQSIFERISGGPKIHSFRVSIEGLLE